MDYLIILALIIASYFYLIFAKKYGIIDKPNERSSHKNTTIRGGGVLFFLAIILFFIFYQFQYPYFTLGLIFVAVVSFIDDIYTISSSVRFPVQLIAVILALFQIGLFEYSFWWIIPVLFFTTGMLNIYNFMDGINGITGLYSIVVVLALLYVNHYEASFINTHLLVIVLSSLIIFGFYNFRKKAKCFAGDIGSISIGLFLIFCVGKLVLITNELSYILFLLIYMVDGGLTIIERLYRKQNILKPHRNHLYQLMVDKIKISHMKVSFVYAIAQALICLVVIMSVYSNKISQILIPLVFITVLYYSFYKKSIINRKTSI